MKKVIVLKLLIDFSKILIMSKFIIEILGYIGALLVSVCFIPQTYKVLTSKKMEDVSKITYIINFCASILFLIYSIYYLLYPIIICNISIFINSFIIIMCGLLYD